MTEARLDRTAALATGAGVAALHTLRFGYSYGTGDHDDLLPPVLARLDPGLFTADPLVLRQLDGVTVRTAFEVLLATLGRIVPLPFAVGLLHVAVLVAVGAGVFALARAFGVGRAGGVLGSVLACVTVPAWTLGGNAVAYAFLSPEGIAWALALPALVWAARDRFWPAAVALGLATWTHALVGLTVGLALGLVVLAGGRERGASTTVRRAAELAVPFGLVAGPFLLLALDTSSIRGAPLEGGLSAFDLYVHLRFPHHLLPSAFPFSYWVRFGVLAAAGGVAWWSLPVAGRAFAVRFLGAVALLGPVAVVGVEGLASFAVARAQLFKLTVPANVLLCIGIGGAIAARLPVQAPSLRPWVALAVTVLALTVAGSRAAAPVPLPSDEAAALDWLRTHTPRDAVILAPPSMSTVRTRGERAVVASWKAVPFQPDEGAEWWRRILLLSPLPALPTEGAGLDVRLDSAYAARPVAHWRQLAAATGASAALIDRTQTPALPEGAPAFTAGRWAVYPLADGAASGAFQRIERNVDGRPAGAAGMAPSGRSGSSGASAPSGPQ